MARASAPAINTYVIGDFIVIPFVSLRKRRHRRDFPGRWHSASLPATTSTPTQSLLAPLHPLTSPARFCSIACAVSSCFHGGCQRPSDSAARARVRSSRERRILIDARQRPRDVLDRPPLRGHPQPHLRARRRPPQ